MTGEFGFHLLLMESRPRQRPMSPWLKRSQLEFTDSNGCILLRSDGAVAGHTIRIARQLSGILPLALVTG